MSLEITLYTKQASKQRLISELKFLGFERCGVFMDAMKSPERVHLMWFGTEHFESFVGVEATVYVASEEERKNYNCSKWILHTRTRSSGSRKDKEKQNETIRYFRKIFGGSFYNDWYGTNRYTNLEDYPNLCAQERGLLILKEEIESKIFYLQYTLNSVPENILKLNLEEIDDKSFRESMQKMEPSLGMYNAMFPYLVALLEYFFKQVFLILIRYSEHAKQKIEDDKMNVSLREVIQVNNGERWVEDLIADAFTFQNLKQTNKAYQQFLKIDVARILSSVKIKKKTLYKSLEELIEMRHGIIHHLSFYSNLNQKAFLEYLNLVSLTTSTFFGYLEKENDWNLVQY